MRITSIVENTSRTGLPVEHGLSLYIQLESGEQILFDMGQSSLFAENAAQLQLSIQDIDTAILSHGHYDHGGGLETFLKLNQKAKVYAHHEAFQPHYSLREKGLAYIGLKKELQTNERFVFCDSITQLAENQTLFADVKGTCCLPVGNRLLYGPSENLPDTFTHEQNLLLEEEGKTVLLAGCAHNGIVNILQKAIEVSGKIPTHVFAGMHLVKSGLSPKEEDLFITNLSQELKAYSGTKFYTMHCTGEEPYQKLKALLGEQIEYLSCGEYVEL